MADEPLFNLGKFDGDFSNVLTKGGIPVTDLSTSVADPNKTTERSEGYNINPASFGTRSPDAARTVVYGRARVGGTLIFYTTDQGLSGQFLHVAFALAGHEIDAVEKLYLDDVEVIFGGGTAHPDPRWGAAATVWDDKVFMSVSTGADDQPANADLVSQSAALFTGLWTVDHRARGIAMVYLILVYDKTVFPNSVPTVSFLVRGKKVYDPRSGLTAWSDNAALCIADYITSARYGCKSTYARIHAATLVEAANIADESVGLNLGGTEARYTANGAFDTSISRQQALESFLPCIGHGAITRLSGVWYIRPAKWRAPALTLNSDDLRSGLRVRCKISRRDNFNGVKGQFFSPDAAYQPVDFPAQTSSFYLAQDGGVENLTDVVYALITSNATAQRVAKITLEKARQPIMVDGTWALRSYMLIPGDTCYLDLPQFGWLQKAFEVVTVRPDGDPNGALGVALSLRETAAGVFDWNHGTETLWDLAPDTFLPDPANVQPLAGLTLESGTDQLLLNGDGTIITRGLLSWTPATDPFAENIEIEYKKSTDVTWQRNPSVDALSTSAFIVNLQDGAEYDFRIRVKNGSNFASAWSELLAQEIVGKTQPPSDVLNFTATPLADGIALSWQQIPDIDRADYVLKIGGVLSDWDSATEEVAVKSTSYKLRTLLSGTYKFFLRARDTSGNLSFFPAGTTVVIPGPATPNATFQFNAETVIFNWTPVSSFFGVLTYNLTEVSSGLLVGSVSGTTLTLPVNWSGYRQFALVAVDAGGNASTPQILDVLVLAPGPVSSIVPMNIGHFVTLHWAPPTIGTLNVSRYRVLRGATYVGAELVGEFFGTFTTIFETVGGTYTYWIQPIDVANNLGIPEFVSVVLSAPSDFVLKSDNLISAFTVRNNVYADPAGFFIGPFNPSETWEAHFQNRGWQSIGDQIDAGYLFYAEPGATDGYVETVVDFGVAFPSTALSLEFDSTVLDGVLTFEPQMSWSADNVTFTAPLAASAVLATNVRYVKVYIAFNGTNQHSLGLIKNVRLRAAVKLESDQGMVTANAGDAGGTAVTFNLPFLDVESIVITPQSTVEVRFAYDFVDAPNPTGFKVLVWDTAGNRVTKTVSWNARGATT